MKTLKTKELK